MGDAEKTTILAAARRVRRRLRRRRPLGRRGRGRPAGAGGGSSRSSPCSPSCCSAARSPRRSRSAATTSRRPPTQVACRALVGQTAGRGRARRIDGRRARRSARSPPRPARPSPRARSSSSDPAGGAKVDEGSEVDLVVSGGPDTIAVPNVVGLDRGPRPQHAGAAPGSPASTPARSTRSRTRATVVAVDPGEGEQAAPNTPITLQVSTGTVKVPDVHRQDRGGGAQQSLTEAGFTDVRSVTQSVERDDGARGHGVGTEPRRRAARSAPARTITLLIAVAGAADADADDRRRRRRRATELRRRPRGADGHAGRPTAGRPRRRRGRLPTRERACRPAGLGQALAADSRRAAAAAASTTAGSGARPQDGQPGGQHAGARPR